MQATEGRGGAVFFVFTVLACNNSNLSRFHKRILKERKKKKLGFSAALL